MISDDIRIVLYRILSGTLFFDIDSETYEFKRITNKTKYEAEIIYKSIINDEKYNEWIRSDNAEMIMTNLGLWTKDTNDMIKQLEKSIENNKVELFSNFLYPDRIKKIRKSLDSYRGQLDRLLSSKQNFIVSHTLEGHAENIKNEHMVCQNLFKNDNRIFDSLNTINASGSYLYFNSLVSELNKHSISMSQYRQIARSDEWRSYWTCNKTNMFDGCVANWTDEQRSLVNITKMYDNIYEHPECPNDKIVEDDDALDGWTIVQKRKNEKNKNQQSIDTINPNLKKAQEVFLMAQDKEEVDNILGLNTPDSLYRMNQKIAAINAVGTIDDINLPDVQNDLRNQTNQQIKNRK